MQDGIEALARRFAGLDLQCRNGGTNWPLRWRAAIVASKNERDEYRLLAYGETAEAALASLAQMAEAAGQP